MRKLLIFLFLVNLHTLGFADSVMTVICEEPKGVRLDVMDKGPKTGNDRIGGVKPTFIFDKSNPSKLIVIFGQSKLAGPSKYDNAVKADVVLNSAHQLTAIEVLPKEVWTYSLFPEKRTGLFLRSSHASLIDWNPHGSVFYSKCTFGER